MQLFQKNEWQMLGRFSQFLSRQISGRASLTYERIVFSGDHFKSLTASDSQHLWPILQDSDEGPPALQSPSASPTWKLPSADSAFHGTLHFLLCIKNYLCACLVLLDCVFLLRGTAEHMTSTKNVLNRLIENIFIIVNRNYDRWPPCQASTDSFHTV